MTTEDLLELKEHISRSETEISRLEGQLEVLMSDLGFKSIKEAEKELNNMDIKLKKYNSEIENGMESIEEEFGWILE